MKREQAIEINVNLLKYEACIKCGLLAEEN
jgi:hypothetical protein